MSSSWSRRRNPAVYDDRLLQRARSSSVAIDGPTVVGHAANALCGDKIEVSARIVDGVIRAAAYRNHGCALTSASASVLADLVLGRAASEALAMGRALAAALADRAAPMPAGFEELALTKMFPARRRCAMLPWDALRNALETMPVA
jgi:nitrogen fixation NifU-like protein